MLLLLYLKCCCQSTTWITLNNGTCMWRLVELQTLRHSFRQSPSCKGGQTLYINVNTAVLFCWENVANCLNRCRDVHTNTRGLLIKGAHKELYCIEPPLGMTLAFKSTCIGGSRPSVHTCTCCLSCSCPLRKIHNSEACLCVYLHVVPHQHRCNVPSIYKAGDWRNLPQVPTHANTLEMSRTPSEETLHAAEKRTSAKTRAAITLSIIQLGSVCSDGWRERWR